jgi:2-succinyl-6-hydroxy-2,4-cyclohexadiene-1-carboxylate synthase
MTIRTRRLALNGIETTYDEAGAGPRAFVLVHGFSGGRDDFTSQLPALAAEGRTIAQDQRGHGDATNTGDPRTYTLAQLVDDLRAFVDALGLARFDLLGHSMGGMVVQRFALQHPERVASLVLMDTTSAPLGLGLPREALAKAAQIARATSMERLHEIMRARAGDNPLRTRPDQRLEQEMGSERYWARIRKHFASMDVEAFEALGSEIGAVEPLTPRLGELRCPTTVLVGDSDKPFLEPSRVMHAAIPGSKLVVIPDGGHSPQLEAPEAWREAIVAHLRAARSTGG